MSTKGRINDYVGHRLQQIRKSRKMTSAEVARRAGIPPGSYSCLENGWYRMNLDSLFRILQVLKADIRQVWPRADKSPKGVVDEEFLVEATRQSMRRQPREVSLDDVYEAVSDAFNIGKDKLFIQSRGWKRLIQARGAIGLIVRQIPYLSLTDLSGSLGWSLSSIGEQTRNFEDAIQEDADLATRFFQARNTIRRSFPSLVLDADDLEREEECVAQSRAS
ncbi:MAG TPA: helix-turn-helix transcriptional regulator [Acidobacteriota bacterium]|nr:helix-turn-helix transcriptional regulator [Acidobacteriota bacterium]